MIPVPDRLKKFPLWKDRYVIHYTVFTKDGIPIFNQVARGKQVLAAKRNWCQLCGERMSAPYWFIGGESNVESRQVLDGPMHEECACYACAACPFLANADYVGKVPAVQGAGFAVAKALVELEAMSPVERPARLALCSALAYRADLRPQFPVWFVSEWATVDWNVMPTRETDD